MSTKDWKSFLSFGCRKISSSRKPGFERLETGGSADEKKKSETTSYCFFSSLLVGGKVHRLTSG
jgi:hypothetical protein